jgi:ankyrin repeat protein
MCASQYGHEACVSLLITHGADVHAEDKDGMTALMCASQYGHEACVSLLTTHGGGL